MKNEEIAYLAGLFDGEGYVGFGKYTSGRKSQEGHTRKYSRLRAHITNTDKNILLWVKSQTGKGYVTGAGQPIERRKQIFRWYVASAGARYFLNLILPYLRIKKEKVKTVLATDGKNVKARI